MAISKTAIKVKREFLIYCRCKLPCFKISVSIKVRRRARQCVTLLMIIVTLFTYQNVMDKVLFAEMN